MSGSKTVRVKRATWLELHERKDPGQTFDDVISAMMEDHAEQPAD